MKETQSIFERFAGIKSEYEIAQSNRIKRNRTGVGSTVYKADYHYRNWSMMARAMETARDIDRNDMVVGQGISRFVNNVIQEGIPLSARTGNREIDNELEDWWRAETESENFSSSGELTFNQQEKLVARHMIVDGDILAVPLDDSTLHLFEAHRLRSPINTRRNVIHGIVFDDRERPQEYWITKESLNPTESLTNVTGPKGVNIIKARDDEGNKQVFHIFNPKRVTQHRGFTSLAPIALPAGFHDDIQIAKLVQQQAASMIAILRERNPEAKYSKPKQKGERREEALDDGTVRTIEGLAYGVEITSQPGETLKGFSGNYPNPEFFKHALMVLQIIAINLDLPLIVFLLDASQTNFSGWRGAWDQAKIGLIAFRKTLTTKLHTPVYLWRLRQYIAQDKSLLARITAAEKDSRALGLAPSRSFNIFRHEWAPEAWPYIQPVEDATANILRVHSLQAPPRAIAAENGYDWGRGVIEPALEDNVLAWTKAIEAARIVNTTLTPDESDWRVSPRDVLVLPLADRINFSITRQDAEASLNNDDESDSSERNGKPKSRLSLANRNLED